jgi:hypothetical protein
MCGICDLASCTNDTIGVGEGRVLETRLRGFTALFSTHHLPLARGLQGTSLMLLLRFRTRSTPHEHLHAPGSMHSCEEWELCGFGLGAP